MELNGCSHRTWKIRVLAVMQPEEVEVTVCPWEIDSVKTLARGHLCNILAKNISYSGFSMRYWVGKSLKIIAWFVYFYSIDKYLFNLPISFFFSLWDRVSLCLPGCPGTYFVDQAVLELRYPPGSASWVLGLKLCSTTTQLPLFLYSIYILIVTPIPFHLP